eukprot:m.352716 g.352716  ORF g.352716 m.352716 type:complete len:290 (+) comp16584_c0_seq10:969-1838(+)
MPPVAGEMAASEPVNDVAKRVKGGVDDGRDSAMSSPLSALEELWADTPSSAWEVASSDDSIFRGLYNATIEEMTKAIKLGDYTAVIEVGSGTGDVIGSVKTALPRYGVDINPAFVARSTAKFATEGMSFHEGDATKLQQWWADQCAKEGKDVAEQRVLVVCTNNTINIVPKEIRATIVEQMRLTAGPSGKCLLTFWNGTFFPHGIMGFYKKHPELCGAFDIFVHADYEKRTLNTDTGYSTLWNIVPEVQSLMRDTYKVESSRAAQGTIAGNSIYEKDIGIFSWFEPLSA